MKNLFSGSRWIFFFLVSFFACWLHAFSNENNATTEKTFLPPEKFARLFRSPETPENLFIEIAHQGEWRLFSGKTQKSIHTDTDLPVLTGHATGRFLLPGDRTGRRYFSLQTDVGSPVFAENPLPLAGGHNFRDLGGIRARAGKRVVWGLFFRGDSMAKLTEKDLAYLGSIPVRTLVDFRTEKEAKRAPDRIPASVRENLQFRIVPGTLDTKNFSEIKTSDEYEKIMREMYRGMIRDEEVLLQYKKFFRLVQDQEKLPVLYHCSAGKDRTGLATALLLSALGVDRRHIMEDYLASNDFLREKYSTILAKHPEMEPVFTVKEHYLLDAFDEIEKNHGSMEYFLRVVLDIDMDKMQKESLYQAEYL